MTLEMNNNPAEVKKLLQYLNKSVISLDDDHIDRILGISKSQKEKIVLRDQSLPKYGSEQVFYEGTPYNFIRYILSFFELKEHDMVYDLGSGYGRFVLYGAIVKDAVFKGIEIVDNRVSNAEKAVANFRLDNAFFYHRNVLLHDYSDGNFFFLFNPFSLGTLEAVGDQLKNIARDKKISIATWGGSSNEYFSECNWLTEITHSPRTYNQIQFFTSN